MLTYGFYNSVNGDRLYNANQLSAMFDGLIIDGIFMSIGDKLMVTASTGMDVIVGTGKAWFKKTWTINDAALPLSISASETVLNRIDVIVLEVNTNEDTRANSIKVVKGTPGSSPSAPALTDTELVKQYPLCHIYVGAGVTEILQSNITNKVGTVDAPYVTAVLEGMDIDALVLQWGTEFNDWMDTLVDILDENTAGNLLNLVNARMPLAGGTFSGGIDLDRNEVLQPKFKDYSEVVNTQATASGAVTLDIANGNIFDLTLSDNITLTFSNPAPSGQGCSFTVIINQGATPKTIAYPASVKWSNDVVPDLSMASKTSILSFITKDGGTRWYGFFAGNKYTT
jgi:hypothetical protein